MEEKIIEKFGNRLRVRVCGILIDENRVLLIKHKSIGSKGILWAPPGGGMHFGESAEESLKREFREETGLEIDVENYLFTHEFLSPPLHAIELFFKVSQVGGALEKGSDPEMTIEEQIITGVKYLDMDELIKMDGETLHYVLRIVKNINELLNLEGYIKFEEIT
jgi:8-oxo-dGTP diphosphatase